MKSSAEKILSGTFYVIDVWVHIIKWGNKYNEKNIL